MQQHTQFWVDGRLVVFGNMSPIAASRHIAILTAEGKDVTVLIFNNNFKLSSVFVFGKE